MFNEELLENFKICLHRILFLFVIRDFLKFPLLKPDIVMTSKETNFHLVSVFICHSSPFNCYVLLGDRQMYKVMNVI